jgi:putative Holliday junction resolvase
MNSPILAVDVGSKKTGLALSESGFLARPLTVIHHSASPADIAARIAEAVAQHDARTIVFGMPYHADGAVSDQGKWVEKVVEEVKPLLPDTVDIDFQDEHGTSLDAQALYPKSEEDAAAAAIILQDYLERFGADPATLAS